MGPSGDSQGVAGRRRNRMWLVALCAGLIVGQPAVAGSQAIGDRVGVSQLQGPFREPVCQLVRSLQAAFGAFPAASGIFASLLQSFGCSGAPAPGTTTSTVVGTTTSSTFASTTTTFVPGTPTTSTTIGTGTTSPTTSTTLPTCLPPDPNTPFPTTVPCMPTTTTTAPMGATTTSAVAT